MKRLVRLTVALSVFLVACGGGGGDGGEGDARTATASGADTFCGLAKELDERAARAYAELGPGTVSTEEVQQFQKKFYEDNREDFDALVRAAPAEIKDEVRTTVAQMRATPKSLSKVKAGIEADRRVKTWKEKNC